jgi:hypothetical protein
MHHHYQRIVITNSNGIEWKNVTPKRCAAVSDDGQQSDELLRKLWSLIIIYLLNII